MAAPDQSLELHSDGFAPGFPEAGRVMVFVAGTVLGFALFAVHLAATGGKKSESRTCLRRFDAEGGVIEELDEHVVEYSQPPSLNGWIPRWLGPG